MKTHSKPGVLQDCLSIEKKGKRIRIARHRETIVLTAWPTDDFESGAEANLTFDELYSLIVRTACDQ